MKRVPTGFLPPLRKVAQKVVDGRRYLGRPSLVPQRMMLQWWQRSLFRQWQQHCQRVRNIFGLSQVIMMLRSTLHRRRVNQVALRLLPRLLLRGRTRRPSATAGGASEIQRSRAWTRPHAARPCRSSPRMFQRPRPRIRQSRWCVLGLHSISSGSATTPPSSRSHLSQWRPSALFSSVVDIAPQLFSARRQRRGTSQWASVGASFWTVVSRGW